MTTGVYKRTEGTKEKMRKRMMGNTYRLGSKPSEKTKQKMRESHVKKGFGHKHTKEAKEKISRALRNRSDEIKEKISKALTGKMPKCLQNARTFNYVKRGWYDILGVRMFFRSGWEANYALYLNFLVKHRQISKWEYESDVFLFKAIKFGTRSYRPDFKIFNVDETVEYHEVKGYMTSRSKTQIKRMAKYYPNIKLIIIDRDIYNDIKNKLGKMLKFY